MVEAPTRSFAAYRCPFCGMVSHNGNDIRQQYCGHCSLFLPDVLDALETSVPSTTRRRRAEVPVYLVRAMIKAIRLADEAFNTVREP